MKGKNKYMNTIVKTNDRTQMVDQVQLVTEGGEYYHMPDIGDTFECLTELGICSVKGPALGDIECTEAATPWWMSAAATGLLNLTPDSSHSHRNDFNDNNTPFSGNNSVMTACHRPVLTDMVRNVTGADSTLLSIEAFTIEGYTTVYQPNDTATVPNVGTLTITTDGMLTFTANDGYVGAIPDLTYAVTDSDGGYDKATITFDDVSDISAALKQSAVANSKSVTTARNRPAEIKVLGNNTDSGSDSLSVEEFTVKGYTTVYQPNDTATVPNVGIVTMTTDGTLTFTPNDGYAGVVPDVTYTVIGGNDGIDTAIVTFEDVPAGVVANNTISMQEDFGTLSRYILGNEKAGMTVAGISINGTEDIAATAVDIIEVGTVKVDAVAVANQSTIESSEIDLADLSSNIQKWSTIKNISDQSLLADSDSANKAVLLDAIDYLRGSADVANSASVSTNCNASASANANVTGFGVTTGLVDGNLSEYDAGYPSPLHIKLKETGTSEVRRIT